MSGHLEAVLGANLFGACSFPIAFTNTSQRTAAALKPGGYALECTQDCWIKVGDNTVVAAAVSATLTQPSPNHTMRLRAGKVYALTIPKNATVSGSDNCYLAVIRDTADGTLDLTGPLQIPG